jgi:hypothetical protein
MPMNVANQTNGTWQGAPAMPQTGRQLGGARRWLAPNFATPAALIIIVVVMFWKTVFLGKPIARIFLIDEWDSLFDAVRHGINISVDPSAALGFFPTYSLVAQQYHHGQLPLWNNLSCFGAPLAGDVQAMVMSPLQALFYAWPSQYSFNLQLVLQVVIAAVGTYALCRTFRIAPVAALLAAVAYAFCPFNLWRLELVSGTCLIPAILCCFAKAGKRRTGGWCAAAGIAAGLIVLSAHPEISFFAIASGTFLMCWFMVPAAGFFRFLRALAFTAISAVCVCAPVFFPFVEFLRNSDCYKFAVGQSAYMPWQALAYNLFSPGFGGASPFLGVLAVPLAAIAVWKLLTGRLRDPQSVHDCAALVSMLGISLALVAHIWPINLVWCRAPFNYLITIYCVPELLLSICLLAGLGMTYFIGLLLENRATLRHALGLALISFGCCGLPLLCTQNAQFFSAAAFDLTLPAMHFDNHAWHQDATTLIMAISILIVLTIARKFGKAADHKLYACIAVSLTVANCLSIVAASRHSLPVVPSLKLPDVAVMNAIAKSGERYLAIGNHLAKPDVNLLYGTDDVRTLNPMVPARYSSFVTACGAAAGDYCQTFPAELPRTLDLASVKYVVSQLPVVGSGDQHPAAHSLDLCMTPQTLTHGLQLLGGSVWSDRAVAGAGGVLRFKTQANTEQLRIVLLVKSASGDTRWFSDPLPIKANLRFVAPIAPNGAEGRLCLRVFDNKRWRFSKMGAEGVDELPLARLIPSKPPHPPHFRLIKEFANNIRLYENTSCLPRAYFASSALPADKSLAYMHVSRVDFDPQTTVVLEDFNGETRFATARRADGTVEVESRTATDVHLWSNAEHDGFVVLTDTYYPGWRAYVDGKPATIYRANYMFRAVRVGAGRHHVRFHYEPASFAAGAALFAIFWMLIGLWTLSRTK